MADYRLVLQMKGPQTGAAVRADDFVLFLRDVLVALAATERHISKSDRQQIHYTIADLKHDSPATVVYAAHSAEHATDYRAPVLNTFIGGLASIVKGTAPPGFDTDLLLDYEPLAKHLDATMPEAT